jgi:hypothetical protein
MGILNQKTQRPRTFYVCKSAESGKFMRKYLRTYTAADIDSAELFKQRGAAATAKSESADKSGVIVKIEVNRIE